jgi:hypothetical protein
MAEEAMVRVWEACAVKREALRRKVSSVGVIVPLEISSRVFSNSPIDLVDVLGHGGRPEVLLVGLGHVERELFVLVGVLMYCKWARERGEGERGGHVWLARTWRACRGSSRGRRGRLCAPPTRVLGSHFWGMEGMRDMVVAARWDVAFELVEAKPPTALRALTIYHPHNVKSPR